MLLRNVIVRTAAIGTAAAFLLTQPAKSQTSDSDRLQKLEQSVQQLQERNAQLEAEIKDLKKHPTSVAAAPPAEGPTKTKITYDGKTYVEKSVPVEKSAADKWKLSTPLTELELFGDVRVRYEYRGGQGVDDSNIPRDWQERERERYRVRFGLRGTLLDDWFFGVRVETSTNPRSTNITFGDDTSGNGPFAKNSDSLNIGQAYAGYKGLPDITLEAGRMPLTDALVTTRMVWDDDINPEGLSERWKHSFSFGSRGGGDVASYSKDGKTVAPAPQVEPFLKLDLFANFGQFVYDDSNPENPLGARPTTNGNGTPQRVPNTDAWLLAWQVGARLNFPHNFYTQVAPTLYNYTGNGDTFNIHYVGGSPGITNAASLATNQTGINSLLIYDMPWELGTKITNLPVRLFGDFAVNVDGGDRATAAGHPDKGDQKWAYQVGVGVGQLKKKHDWQVEALWQRTEQYSLDPNLVDSDLFDSRVNMEGVAVRAGYMLSDAVWLNVTWGYGWQADDSLGTGGTGDLGVNPLDHYQLLQADLNVKF